MHDLGELDQTMHNVALGWVAFNDSYCWRMRLMMQQSRKKSSSTRVVAVLVSLYLIFLSLSLLYLVFGLTSAQRIDLSQNREGGNTASIVSANSSAADSTTITATNKPEPVYIAQFQWGKHPLHEDAWLFLLVVGAGALGSALHALRSLYWYIGNRAFTLSWVPMYFILPVTGALLAAGTYFLIRGGFIAATASNAEPNPYGFTSIGFIVGLFTQQAVIKLQQIAETILVKPDPGRNSYPQGATTSATPDFTITATPDKASPDTPGETVSYDVAVTAQGGFNSNVDLSVEGLPKDAPLPSFSPAAITAAETAQTSVLTVITDGIAEGVYTLTITGKSGSKIHSTMVTLEVIPVVNE
jgi:hypothetical protein